MNSERERKKEREREREREREGGGGGGGADRQRQRQRDPDHTACTVTQGYERVTDRFNTDQLPSYLKFITPPLESSKILNLLFRSFLSVSVPMERGLKQ